MFSMRITLFVSLFLLIQIIWSQQKEASVIDSISIDKELNNTLKDTIVSNEKIVLDEIKKQDSASKSQKSTKKYQKRKNLSLSSNQWIRLAYMTIKLCLWMVV